MTATDFPAAAFAGVAFLVVVFFAPALPFRAVVVFPASVVVPAADFLPALVFRAGAGVSAEAVRLLVLDPFFFVRLELEEATDGTV